MLRQIRGALKGVVSIFVVALLVLAFAAWGVPEIRQLSRSYAVRVGDEGFTALEVQKEFDRFLTNRRLATQGEFDREQAIAAGAHEQIVQSMATRSALDQEAHRMGLVMPRATVTRFLQDSEQFKNPRTGKFDSEVLTGILREYNYGVREFEDRLQSDLLRNQLISALAAGSTAPKPLIDALVLRETEQRAISYVTVTDEVAGPAAAPTPEALRKFHKEQAAQFMAPEYRTFTAVVLKSADFAEGALSEADLRKLYEASRSKYETPERRTIHQLTFDEEAEAKAAAAALKSGRPFESLADEQGKSLAEATLVDADKDDILDPKVADAAFSASQAGAVVGPIKGVFGHTVAQVASITPAAIRSFEEVRAELEQSASAADAKKRLFETIDEIENARDTGAALAEAARQAGAAAIEYGPVDSYSFGKGGEIVAGVPGEILKAAFKLEEGEESDATELADKSGYYFVSVTEITPAALIPFERVAAEVEAKWRAEEIRTRIAKMVDKIRAEVDKGKSLQEAAAPINRAPVSQTVTRRSAGELFSEALIEQIFAAAKGETVSGPAAAGDAQLVIRIDEVGFDVAKVSPEDVSLFARYVGQQIHQELADAYAAAVRDDAGVRLNEAQIDALFAEGQ